MKHTVIGFYIESLRLSPGRYGIGHRNSVKRVVRICFTTSYLICIELRKPQFKHCLLLSPQSQLCAVHLHSKLMVSFLCHLLVWHRVKHIDWCWVRRLNNVSIKFAKAAGCCVDVIDRCLFTLLASSSQHWGHGSRYSVGCELAMSFIAFQSIIISLFQCISWCDQAVIIMSFVDSFWTRVLSSEAALSVCKSAGYE